MNESCNCGLSTDLCAISLDEYCNYTCYPIGGLLASKLFCFYDEECVRTVYVHISNYSFSIAPLLNSNITSRFNLNSTIRNLINALAIEEWNDQTYYELYYQNCNPAKCFYTMTNKLHISTVVTTVVGLFGGLSVVLRIVIPPVIKFIRWFRRKQNGNMNDKRKYIFFLY